VRLTANLSVFDGRIKEPGALPVITISLHAGQRWLIREFQPARAGRCDTQPFDAANVKELHRFFSDS
jgi:hypothetical protein